MKTRNVRRRQWIRHEFRRREVKGKLSKVAARKYHWVVYCAGHPYVYVFCWPFRNKKRTAMARRWEKYQGIGIPDPKYYEPWERRGL